MVYKLRFIIMIILFISGCSWFNPREADKPWQEESQWQEPTSPSIVILNLQRAFEGKNIVNYSACFSENFIFYGDPADSVFVQPGAFKDWNYNVEVDVATKLFNTFADIELYFSDSLKDSTGAEANIYETYNMNLQTPDSSVFAKGLAEFRLTIDTLNLWYIVEWKDFGIDSNCIDWGILKAKAR